ncbi:MAG: helix-turn-helix transcriptional regulator [Prolixibacteraceae bacterium]|nr:helix-turn-helix transcriptional regulator [Prolixibacteraceae bacterium]
MIANNFSDIFKKIGLKIKLLRIERKISQQDLAAACNFEKSNLAQIESRRTNPTIATLLKICQVLDVPISQLFNFEDIENISKVKE